MIHYTNKNGEQWILPNLRTGHELYNTNNLYVATGDNKVQKKLSRGWKSCHQTSRDMGIQ